MFNKYEPTRRITRRLADDKTEKIQDCFIELEASKNLYDYNEKKNSEVISTLQTIKRPPKDIHGVKECLAPQQLTRFQALIAELTDTASNSYWNQEIGKPRDQTPNLPPGMDIVNTTFGGKNPKECTMAELINPPIPPLAVDHLWYDMYRKTHSNCSQPGEQTCRKYDKPYDKNDFFGKHINADNGGARIKKLLSWTNNEQFTPVNRIQADYVHHSKSRIGKPKYYEPMHLMRAENSKMKKYNIADALCDCPRNNEVLIWHKCLEHINELRLKLKKRFVEVPFFDICDELSCLDTECTDFLPKEKVFQTLAKYHVHPTRNLFEKLLDLLHLSNNGYICYHPAVNLLNWKQHFPDLPKLNVVSPDCLTYSTTYKDTIGALETPGERNMRSAGLPNTRSDVLRIVPPRDGARFYKEHLGDQTSVYALISPSIFTKYGLDHIDFIKVRNQEEIKSLFECIGVKFSPNSFNTLWQKGLEQDGTDGVCVETFKNLLIKLDTLGEDFSG